MADVLERRRPDRRHVLGAGLAIGAAVAGGWLAVGCSPRNGAVIPAAGHERAAALVAAYARAIGAPDRKLTGDDVAFGESGFFYEAKTDTLFGRVYVTPAYVKDAPPAELANHRRVARALNDPAIGGMFDRGGGYFVLDEGREAYFLVRPFAVPATDPTALIAAMERMHDVAATWTTKWFYRVAMIVGGHAPAPSRPVTLADPG